MAVVAAIYDFGDPYLDRIGSKGVLCRSEFVSFIESPPIKDDIGYRIPFDFKMLFNGLAA